MTRERERERKSMKQRKVSENEREGRDRKELKTQVTIEKNGLSESALVIMIEKPSKPFSYS